MKKLALIFMLITVFSFMYGATITHTYNFNNPKIVNTDGVSELIFDNCVNFGNEGDPLIPLLGAKILLPQDSEVVGIKVLSANYEILDENITLKAAGKIHPLSIPVEDDYSVVQNEKIYSSSDAYPKNIVENPNTNFLGGHSIASFTICPIKYYPTLNDIEILTSITVEIATQTSSRQASLRDMLSNSQNIKSRVNTIVDNPDEILSYSYANTNRDVEIDLLIITNQDLANSFNEYIEYKKSTGYITETVFVEDIETTYPGEDLQEKIRNCVIDYYQNYNLQYLILGGDSSPNNSSDNIIPHRGFYANPGSAEYQDEDIPSDLYYGCLDGNWNADNDNLWGEVGEEDMLAEVYVGRICVDSPTEVINMTHKLYMYQNEPVIADLENFLLMGEYLWTDTYGGTYMNELIGFCNTNGYTTNGITENITNNTLYELDQAWGANSVYNQFNNVGINMLHHLGHSNTDYNMHLYTNNVTTANFTNDGISRGYVLGYSQGCYPGSFDNRGTSSYQYGADCIAEKLTTISTAEAAFIANSRYGWGQQGSTNGASQIFHRQYVDAIFAENITAMGIANADSKEDNISYINSSGVIRWCAYETNLFGDPSLDIWTATPEDLIVSHAPSVSIGTSEISFNTDAPYARIALSQAGILIGRGVANSIGNIDIETFAPISSPENITISIIGHNKNRYFGEIIVVSDQPYVIIDEFTANDNDGNGQIDYSESVELDIVMKNVGTEPANSVEVTLTTENEYITITQNTASFGNIAASDLSTQLNAFSFEVDATIPDLENVVFILTASSPDYEDWSSHFNVSLHAPILSNETVEITDSAGNNNNLLDPGETVQLAIPAMNVGHSDSPSANATLSCNNEYVTIENPNIDLGTIAAGTAEDAIFNITISEDIAIGAIITFIYDIQADEYTYNAAYPFAVGLIIEDFESGDLESFDWQEGANTFEISNGAYSGEYCIKSEDITDNQDAYLEIDMEVISDGEISFYRKVSCEEDANNNWDYLAFYIDNTLQDKWDGEEGWALITFDVSAGDHTFKWQYHKDGAVSNGADCAWVDKITFPSVSFELPPTLSVSVYEYNIEMMTNETMDTIFNISNVGVGSLNYNIVATPNWMSFSPETGTLDTGELNEITVTFNTEGLAPITYNSEIVVSDDFDNEISIPVSLSLSELNNDDLIPAVTELNGNYPNPFNPTTTIKFSLANAENVKLTIYNIKGQTVRSLVNEKLDAGYHSIIWDGKDNSGKNSSSGIFFYRFTSKSYSSTKKMMMLK